MAELLCRGLVHQAADGMFKSLVLLLAIREPPMGICRYRLVLVVPPQQPSYRGHAADDSQPIGKWQECSVPKQGLRRLLTIPEAMC